MAGTGKVLLLGSVRLRSVEDVMATASEIVGNHLTRLPDGEIAIEPWGPSRGFVTQLRPVVTDNPALEPDPDEAKLGHRRTLDMESHRDTRPPRYRIRAGVDPSDVRMDTTGLADTALKSYEIFRKLQAARKIPASMRFQVCLPTVAAFLNTHVLLKDHAAIEPPYRRALFADLGRISATVPHDELTVQWDISTEMAQWEGVRETHFDNVHEGVIDRLALHCNQVPVTVELGVHLCYGNFNLKHWREPESLANTVEVFNRLSERVRRPIAYVHMPVPIARSDDAYFAPLDGLRLKPETTLYLGLMHERDGVEGARRRIGAARKHIARFGIATECGFGERPAETVPDLLRLHAKVAEDVLA
jgi:hypothetical protein